MSLDMLKFDPAVTPTTSRERVQLWPAARVPPLKVICWEPAIAVSVAVEQQSFNALVQWLAGIESEQGYVIDRASIDRASEEGLVNGQFRFR